MLKVLIPDQSASTIYDIDMDKLFKKGYDSIILDLDNTIAPWNSNEIAEELMNWIKQVQFMGFNICLLSNSRSQRVTMIARRLGIMAAPIGGKPFAYAFRRALDTMKANPDKTVVIGDQIFTDILGGNHLKLHTILVDPIDGKEFVGTKITRWFERVMGGRG